MHDPDNPKMFSILDDPDAQAVTLESYETMLEFASDELYSFIEGDSGPELSATEIGAELQHAREWLAGNPAASPEAIALAREAIQIADGGESPYRSDEGVARAKLAAVRIHYGHTTATIERN